MKVTTLREEPFALQPGQDVNVIARAKNVYGWGEYSQWNLYDPDLPIRIQIPPQFWPEISLVIDGSTLTSLKVEWSPPASIYETDEAYF